MAKIYRVFQIKLNQLVYEMCTWSMTYQQSVFKRYHSDRHLSEFLPTRWRQKSTGIDMEQNYVTVIICITAMWHRSHGMWRAGSMKLSGVRPSAIKAIMGLVALTAWGDELDCGWHSEDDDEWHFQQHLLNWDTRVELKCWRTATDGRTDASSLNLAAGRTDRTRRLL